MIEQQSVQGVFDFIKTNLLTFMTEESFVGANDFVFKRVVEGRDILLRLKKDGNNIGMKLQVGDLNGLLVASLPCACCLPFTILAGQRVIPHVFFQEDRELLVVQVSKPLAPERYSIEADFRAASLHVLHVNHLLGFPPSPCFSCSNTPFMTCGA